MEAIDKDREEFDKTIHSLASVLPILLTVVFVLLSISSVLSLWSFYHVFNIDISYYFGIKDYIERSIIYWLVYLFILAVTLPFFNKMYKIDLSKKEKGGKSGAKTKYHPFAIIYIGAHLIVIAIFLYLYYKHDHDPFYIMLSATFIISLGFYLLLHNLRQVEAKNHFIHQYANLFIVVVIMWLAVTFVFMTLYYARAHSLKSQEGQAENQIIVTLKDKTVLSGVLVGQAAETIFLLKADKIIFINKDNVAFEERPVRPTMLERIFGDGD